MRPFALLAAALLSAGPVAADAAEPAAGVAASPSPSPSQAPFGDRTLTVVCARTPFYVFLSGTDRPERAHTPAATAGERFALVSGPRTTLESVQFYETNVAIVEPGYPAGSHYWLTSGCAIPSK